MQKRILPIALTAITFISLIGWNCTKLDTTDIGSDLLPAVDNVNTFADTLLINSTQETFFSDSTYIGKYDDYAIGSINNDPLFGTTKADIYMQLKPAFFPFFFGNAGDTVRNSSNPGDVGVDSIILCLKYKGFWGDSALPIRLQVSEVFDNRFRDSVLKENNTYYAPATGAPISNVVTVDPLTMANYVRYNYGKDSISNQIRIKITNSSWITTLFNRDSTQATAGNNAFYNDSTYRYFYNGIAVKTIGTNSNGLLYASLSDTSTKLEIYYRKKAKGSTAIDSVYTSFSLYPTGVTVSNTSNHIVRNRAGAAISSPSPDEHFLQTSPGSFVNLKIPGLATLSNRIIHRAEIIIEQIPTTFGPLGLDEKLSAPNFLYLDLKDTGTTAKWKPIYFDLNTAINYDPDYKNGNYFVPSDPSSGGVNVNFTYFGGYKRTKPDPLTPGSYIKYYNFNISRYVQQIVTNHTRSYDMRLYAPFNLNYPQYSPAYFAYGNNIAFGRVRIGSGSNPNYRMKLRIVYSKL